MSWPALVAASLIGSLLVLWLPPERGLAQDHPAGVVSYRVEGGAIGRPLGGLPGDAARGRAVLFDAERGNCTICHVVPAPDQRFHGNVGPSLAGVGSRLSAGQIRLRLVDGTRLNPATVMPSYHRVEGLRRVAAQFQGRPVLTAQEIEDVVTFLTTLRD